MTPPRRGALRVSDRSADSRTHWGDYVSQLCISVKELESIAGRRGVWVSLLRLLPMQKGTIEEAENASNHSFLPQPNSMHVRLTGDSKLAIGV